MAIPRDALRMVQDLSPETLEWLLKTKLRPEYGRTGLVLLRTQSGRERDLRELYRNRAPYELLQNADDVSASIAVFVLHTEGLAFLHDGRWFTTDNFKNLAEGWSDKNPSECIGHKGIGFRSVLDLTPAPHILRIASVGFFGVKFTWALNNGHIQETFRLHPELRQEYEDWTKHGQLACPVMSIPGPAKKAGLGAGASIFDQAVRGAYGPNLTTMFWFPAGDPDILPAVLRDLAPMAMTSGTAGCNRLTTFLDREVSVLLPFLRSVGLVKVFDNTVPLGSAFIPEGKSNREGEFSVVTNVGGKATTNRFFQMRLKLNIPPEVRNQPDTPRAFKMMRQAEVALSVKLEGGQPHGDPDSRFHVYFPTEERTGFGFLVHGDFHVRPDRTRLMAGAYNQWLLARAARAAANDFLTVLLDRFKARAVFEALGPYGTSDSEAARTFAESFGSSLQSRQEPYVPTSHGLVSHDMAILPPEVDTGGFWHDQFSEVVARPDQGGKVFLNPADDGDATRRFLHLAGVDVLQIEALLDFMEVAADGGKDAAWWYRCYQYMALHHDVGRWPADNFRGRRLVPVYGSKVVQAGERTDLVIVMPPRGRSPDLTPPVCFSTVFVLLNRRLSDLLQAGEEEVARWVTYKLGISRFEATELLPRAISVLAPQMFSGTLPMSKTELGAIWCFVRAIVGAGREIADPDFWKSVGRLPVPLWQAEPDGFMDHRQLSPAFLAYWPESWPEGYSCLNGVPGLRRVEEEFLQQLCKSASRQEWFRFLNQAGVSSIPRLRTFKRIVPGSQVAVTKEALRVGQIDGFTGDRQADENSVALAVGSSAGCWDHFVSRVPTCGHQAQRFLQTLTVVEGFAPAVQKAVEEHKGGDGAWKQRLQQVMRVLADSPAMEDPDTVFCLGGGGHSVITQRYIDIEMGTSPWLPSSYGPMRKSECFLRMAGRRFIGSGTTGEELGDVVLSYVVADTIEDFARLQRLGLESLDDAESANSKCLVRFLTTVGARLSTEWGRGAILTSRAKWRLVRGAIQEAYKVLNRRDEEIEFPTGMRLAVRALDGVAFHPGAWYYAQPGSPIEKAFLDCLPLLDVDRVYERFFERLSVTGLTPGKTLKERLSLQKAAPAEGLRTEVVERLAPWLFALVLARSEDAKASAVVVRRVKERLDFIAAEAIRATYALADDPSVEKTIDFPMFFLKRELLPGSGAIREAHFTLNVVGGHNVSLLHGLDADALGAALAPVFMEEVSEEVVSSFSRIASRWQAVEGRQQDMEEFLLRQMGVSHALQYEARVQILEEQPTEPATQPPPAVVINDMADAVAGGATNPAAQPQEVAERHQQLLQNQVETLVEEFLSPPVGPQQTRHPPEPRPTETRRPGGLLAPTPEQQERGRRGEEEIKRRLLLPGGWMGFTLTRDVRQEEHFDFLCRHGARDVKMEVKTFVVGGHLVYSAPELREAAAWREDYYLVGLYDNADQPSSWRSWIRRDPLGWLLSRGVFSIEPRLVVPAPTFQE